MVRRHELRQNLSQRVPQQIGVAIQALLKHYVCGQPLISSPVIDRSHSGFCNSRKMAQGPFNLLQFNSVSAHFHLPVHPAKTLEIPIGKKAAQVAGTISPRAGVFSKRVRHEARSRFCGIVQVPSGEPRAAGVDLARDPGGRWLAVNIEHP